MAIKCPKCHSEYPDTKQFCADCGTSLTALGTPGVSVTRTIETTTDGLIRGSTFAGRYAIIGELGRGGMGIVYKAKDTKLDRIVALKFLPSEWTSDPQAKERFIREARAAAALDHPNICGVYEIDEAEGRMFISMAFVEGESLKTKIERGPLKHEEAVDIGMQVASGLKEAHRKGIVHRDIKSANIMITNGVQAKILDFGLAKVRGGVMMTKEGVTVGTVAYMSPEQARGEEVDLRTDIWSLGVVLYQSLTGQLPFQGEHDQVVLHSILNQEPKLLRKLRGGIPIALEQIIERALKKEREERYQSADELLADLIGVKNEFEAGSSEKGLSWLRILAKRRVPQILGLYFLTSLGILQLVKWLVNRFILSPHLPDFSLAALLSFVPTVLLLAYFHGRPGQKRWAKPEKIGIPANLLASAALLAFLFYGKTLGAATTTVIVKNEQGQTVERVVPRREFIKSLAIFFFENKTTDPSQSWLQYGIPLLLDFDLVQDLFFIPNRGYDFFDKIKAAGFPEGVGLPLALKVKIAHDEHNPYFISGSFSKEGEELLLEISIYETKRAIEVAKSEFRGKDIFKLTDQMSLKIKRDLGIPEQYIKDEKNLPVSEMVTASVQAFKSYIDGINAAVFEKNWDKGLKKREESVTEDPTFAYAYYDIERLAAYMNQPEKREQAFKSLMQNLYKLPERIQYLIKADYYGFKEDTEKQIAVLKMMGELNPEDMASHIWLMDIYSNRNQRDEALAEAKRILEIDPELKQALLGIGSLYEQKGKYKEALKYYEKYAAQFPEEVRSFTAIGGLYRTMGDFERAKSYFKRALLIEPENISVILALADTETDLGNFGGSEKICQEALANAKTPENKIQVYWSLSYGLEKQGRFRKSLEYILLLSDEQKKIQLPFMALLLKINYLNKYIRAGQKGEAFKIVKEIQSQAAPPYDTVIPFAYLGMYLTLEDVEKVTQALKDVDSTPLSSIFNDYRPAILESRGRVHEMRGEYEQAITTYEKYSETNPTDLSIYMDIGRTYRKLKDFKKSEVYLQKRLKTSPFDPELHYELSLLYIETKDKQKALEHLNIALNIWKNADPGIPHVEDAKKKLAELKVPGVS